MGLLDELVSAQGGQLVNGLADQFGLDSVQAQKALGSLLPALQGGLAKNAAQPGGVEALLGALQSGSHAKYLESSRVQTDAAAVQEGNAILGHVLGSKDVSRQVASKAASETGIGDDLLKKMLPVIATMAMGALSKKFQQDAGAQSAASGTTGAAPQGGMDLGALGGLAALLQDDGDGFGLDDVADLAGKFLNR